MRSITVTTAVLAALLLFAVPAAADSAGGRETDCENPSPRDRSECRFVERREEMEEQQRQQLEASCGRDPSQPACAAACTRSANDVREGETALRQAKRKLSRAKRRLAAAKRARQQATTERARQRTGAVKRRRAAVVRNDKASVRRAKAALRDERGDVPSFCA